MQTGYITCGGNWAAWWRYSATVNWVLGPGYRNHLTATMTATYFIRNSAVGALGASGRAPSHNLAASSESDSLLGDCLESSTV